MIYFVEINAKYVHSNLALRYFESRLNKQGVPNNRISLTINHPYQLMLSAIVQHIYGAQTQDMAQDCLFFSCYIWNIDWVLKLAADIKQLEPNISIFLGGPEVSFHSSDWLSHHAYIDGLIQNEGEGFFDNLIEVYLKGPTIFSSWLAEGSGKIHEPHLVDMDSLGMGYSMSELQQFKIIYYESSRGCPYRCSYCMSSLGSKLRFKSLKKVEEEVALLMSARIPVIKFIDRTFNAPVERAISILKMISEYDNGISTFHFELSPNGLTQELITLIASLRPNLVQFELGIQSTHPETLKEINRVMPLSTMKQVKDLCKLNNCHTHLDLIVGLPYETYSLAMKSIDDVLALEPDHLQLGMLKMLHGSPLSKAAKQYAYLYSDHAPYEFISHQDLSYGEKCDLMAVEEGLEKLYNSERLQMTLAYLHGHLSSPAHFYLAVGKALRNQLTLGFQTSFEQALVIAIGLIDDLELIEALKPRIAYDAWKNDYAVPHLAHAYKVNISPQWHEVIRNNISLFLDEHETTTTKQIIKRISIIKVPFRSPNEGHDLGNWYHLRYLHSESGTARDLCLPSDEIDTYFECT